MDISSCLKWLSTEIPVPLQWLAWFIGIAAVVGGGMTLLRRIFEKPKLELHLGNTNTHLTCTILNIPIKHKLLRLIGLKRRTDNINVVYYIGKRGDRAIIFCDKPFSGYRPLPASTYEGLSFDIKPTRRDSWFDKKEKPLNDGAYTILFEVDHDNNNKTEWVKTFFIKKVSKKITMVWLDETKDYCTKMIAEPNKISCKEL